MGLIALGLAESVSAPALILHAIGLTLVTGRVLHAYGMSQSPQIMPLRVSGILLTITAIGAGSLAAAVISFQRLVA
ncbi:MAG: MAPEG family protein [Filomicrobium sp.]